jgi:hypothetical protein
MKSLQSPHPTIRLPRRLQPKYLDDASEERALQLLEDDLYWHHRLKRVLSAAGFGVRRIESEEAHPVWLAWLTRGSVDLPADNTLASRHIRRLLTKAGLKVKPDEFRVLRQDGDRLRCVFLFNWGAAGVVT